MHCITHKAGAKVRRLPLQHDGKLVRPDGAAQGKNVIVHYVLCLDLRPVAGHSLDGVSHSSVGVDFSVSSMMYSTLHECDHY